MFSLIYVTLFLESESNSSELLPEWLRVLIVSACCLNSADQLRFVAISTLLGLVCILFHSVILKC